MSHPSPSEKISNPDIESSSTSSWWTSENTIPQRTTRLPEWNRSTGCPMHCYSLVVCRHTRLHRWLAVEETEDRGWWLPGGFVEYGEDHVRGALRETMEEAGVRIAIKGILRVESDMCRGKQRVIFYAEPIEQTQQRKSLAEENVSLTPKTIADQESMSSKWMDLQELQRRSTLERPEGLRSRELLEWATYLENGGVVYPLALFTTDLKTPVPTA